MKPVLIVSRTGAIPGYADEQLAYYDYPDPETGALIRHFILLNEGIKLMYEPWGFTDTWYVDLIQIRWVGDDCFDILDLYLDIVIKGNGPTYRVIDCDELADALISGNLSVQTVCQCLKQLDSFLERYIHRTPNFPPPQILPYLPEPSTTNHDRPEAILPIQISQEGADQVATIVQRSFAQQADLLGVNPSDHPRYVAYEQSEDVRHQLGKGHRIYLGWLGETPMGTVRYNIDQQNPTKGYINRLAVLPEYRGKNYGRSLMNTAERSLSHEGVTDVEISIAQPFTKLQAYYESLGYLPGASASYPSLPFPVLFMHKTLPSPVRITQGEVDVAASIMREAAGWVIDIGKPMWSLEDLTREKLLVGLVEDNFHVAWSGRQNAATMILQWQDPLFWPDIPVNTSGFIHKVAVRRKFAGKGLPTRLIQTAIAECQRRGLSHVRLDTDADRESLCRFYENLGFIRVGNTRALHHGRYVNIALYELALCDSGDGPRCHII